jgi:TonB family protein
MDRGGEMSYERFGSCRKSGAALFSLLSVASLALMAFVESAAAQPPPFGPPQSESTANSTADSPNRLPTTTAPKLDIPYSSKFSVKFPPEALRAGHFGTVTLLLEVGKNGSVVAAKVAKSTGYAELDASAMDLAVKWRFSPCYKDGAPQTCWVRVPINFGPGQKPAHDVTTAAPPQGLVSAMNSEHARAMLKSLSGGSAVTLLNGFVTADDLQKLDSGGIAGGNRYALVLQPAQFTGHTFSPAVFASVRAWARKTDSLSMTRNDANAQMDAQKDSRPGTMKDLHITAIDGGNVVLDTSSCIARSGQFVMAMGDRQIPVDTIIAFIYADNQLFTASGYARKTPADMQWLANEFLPWLRGICGAE